MQLNVLQDLVQLTEVVQHVLLMHNLVMETLFYNVKLDITLLINIWQLIILVMHVVLEQQHAKIHLLL